MAQIQPPVQLTVESHTYIRAGVLAESDGKYTTVAAVADALAAHPMAALMFRPASFTVPVPPDKLASWLGAGLDVQGLLSVAAAALAMHAVVSPDPTARARFDVEIAALAAFDGEALPPGATDDAKAKWATFRDSMPDDERPALRMVPGGQGGAR